MVSPLSLSDLRSIISDRRRCFQSTSDAMKIDRKTVRKSIGNAVRFLHNKILRMKRPSRPSIKYSLQIERGPMMTADPQMPIPIHEPLSAKPSIATESLNSPTKEEPPVPVHSFSRSSILKVLALLLDENRSYFDSTQWYLQAQYPARFGTVCHRLLICLPELSTSIKEVQEYARLNDYDENTPGNGYRSIICIADTCFLHLIRILRHIQQQRTSLMFRTAYYCKELEAYASVFDFLFQSMRLSMSHLRTRDEKNALFPTSDEELQRSLSILKQIEKLDNSCFYGRALGFPYFTSVGHVFHVIGIVLATYSVRWERGGGMSIANLLHSGRFILSPEQRARRIVKVTREADISLCKGFWNLSEEGLYYKVPNWLGPTLIINTMIKIGADHQAMHLAGINGQMIKIPVPSAHTGPRPVSVRIMSRQLRPGQRELLQQYSDPKVEISKNQGMLPEKSSRLLFHVHGGGFVATSTRSHENYLRYWAAQLNCPVLSIEYSLAPEDRYPRMTEEVLYAYAWAIEHADLLGWTGERIVLAGDSAGGNLIMSLTMRAVSMNIARLPDGLVQIYTPFMFIYAPSPSRLLHTMDPLLQTGVVTRCIAAYTGLIMDDEVNKDKEAAAEHGKGSPSKKSLMDYCEEVKKASIPYQPDGDASEQPITGLINVEAICAADDDTPSNYGTPAEEIQPATFTLNEDDDMQPEELSSSHRRPSLLANENLLRQRSDSHAALNVSISAARSTDDAIFLTHVEGGDAEFVKYLSEHPLLSRTLDVDAIQERQTRRQTSASMSMPSGSMNGMSSSPQKYIAIASPQKTMTSVTSTSYDARERSFSQSVTETVSLAAGQIYDNLSNLIDTSASIVGYGDDREFRRPLDKCDSIGTALSAAAGVQRNPSQQESDDSDDGYEAMINKLAKAPVLRHPEVSPMFATDEQICKLPPMYFVCGQLDPLLDDTIAFAKRARDAGAPVRQVVLLDALPHGFLNFTSVSPECRLASKQVLEMITSAFIGTAVPREHKG